MINMHLNYNVSKINSESSKKRNLFMKEIFFHERTYLEIIYKFLTETALIALILLENQ